MIWPKRSCAFVATSTSRRCCRPWRVRPQPLAADYLQRQALARRLAHLGFLQTVTYGFISPEADAAFAAPGNGPEGRTLANPLGQEYSVMRGTLLSSLRATAEQNLRQGVREIRLFEVAPTFTSGPQGPAECYTLGLAWGGTLGGEDYLSPARPVREADLSRHRPGSGSGFAARGALPGRGPVRLRAPRGGPAPGRGADHPGLPPLQPLPRRGTGPVPPGGSGPVLRGPGLGHAGGPACGGCSRICAAWTCSATRACPKAARPG